MINCNTSTLKKEGGGDERFSSRSFLFVYLNGWTERNEMGYEINARLGGRKIRGMKFGGGGGGGVWEVH